MQAREAKRAEMTVAEIGYQILAGDKIYASGHVDPGRRYCPRDTLSLLPEGARTSPRIDTTDQDARIPSELLDSAVTLAELLTRSAAEMIAERYYEVAQKLGPAPPPIRRHLRYTSR